MSVYNVLCLIQNVRGRGIRRAENRESRLYGMTCFQDKNNPEASGDIMDKH